MFNGRRSSSRLGRASSRSLRKKYFISYSEFQSLERKWRFIRVPLSLTHQFNTKEPLLFISQFPQLNFFWCWTKGFWVLKRRGSCVELMCGPEGYSFNKSYSKIVVNTKNIYNLIVVVRGYGIRPNVQIYEFQDSCSDFYRIFWEFRFLRKKIGLFWKNVSLAHLEFG